MMKETYVLWLIVMIAALGLTACDDSSPSTSDPDGGSQCEPSENCCTEDGTWRTDCVAGCDKDSGNCWPQCDPAYPCCQADGTDCPHGCYQTQCYPECNPSNDVCCELDGTWTLDIVQQLGTLFYWKRCPLGQDWDLVTCSCTGVASTMKWCEAMGEPADTDRCPAVPATTNMCESTFGTGYRLPAWDDFTAVLGDCILVGGAPYTCDTCADSDDCTEMFGADTGWYWSSTSSDVASARYADFGDGDVDDTDKSTLGSVRCMRTEL
jgi:hypothetical protein